MRSLRATLQLATAIDSLTFRLFAYDRADKLQQFNKGWDEATARRWTVVSMKDDWKNVFPPPR